MERKTKEDANSSFQVALTWDVSTKNTLPIVHGYSHNQFTFNRKFIILSLLNDKLPEFEGVSSIEVVSLGWEYKQVPVKHGGTYITVYPIHLVPDPET